MPPQTGRVAGPPPPPSGFDPTQPSTEAAAPTNKFDPSQPSTHVADTSDYVDKAFSGAQSITGPPSWWEAGERWLPAVGATIGGLVEPLGGEIGGAMVGHAWQTLSGIARRGGKLPPPPPGPPQSPAEAGKSEMERQAHDIVGEGLTTGLGQTLLGKAGSKVLSGVMRPAAGTTDAAVGAVNKELGLRLGAHEITPDTARGIAATQVSDLGNFGFAGRTLNAVYQKIREKSALQGAARGQTAFTRVKDALNTVVNQGPDYDMLGHKVEAARVFSEEVAPRLLALRGEGMSPATQQLLQSASTGTGLSPQLALKAIKAAKKAVQQGSKEVVPTGQLDTLERVLSTRDMVKFGDGTALRTSLIELGKQPEDALLGARASALTRKFTGDLTDGLSTAYNASSSLKNPGWDELRALYKQGAQGLEQGTPANALLTENANPERVLAAQTRANATPGGYANETHAIENLTRLNAAMQRSTIETTLSGAGMRKFLRFVPETIAVGAGTYAHGVEGGLTAAAFWESFPTMVAWASHSPTMTKWLTEGLTSKDTSLAIASLGRVAQAYYASQAPSDETPAVNPHGPPPQMPTPQSVTPSKGRGGGAGLLGGPPSLGR